MILGGWIITKSRYFCCLSEITWEIDLNICNVLWKCIWHVLRVGLLFLYRLLLYTMYKYHTYTHTHTEGFVQGETMLYIWGQHETWDVHNDGCIVLNCMPHLCKQIYKQTLFLINLIKHCMVLSTCLFSSMEN